MGDAGQQAPRQRKGQTFRLVAASGFLVMPLVANTRIILIMGVAGSGKTTIGHALATQLG